jgi:DNA repair exonuclease SbcCD ATPase subunit
MKCIESFSLAGYGPFKDLEFKVEPGVTTIYGLNKASGKNSQNSNGVGKSAAFHSLSEIIYEEPVVGEKQDSIKTGTRTLRYTNARGKRILVTRASNGRSDSLKINVDGEDMKFRTSSLARQWFKKNWAIGAEEFGTYVHLDSRIPHPLVMGNSAQRKAFFTSFFGLDKIDAERKLYVAELSKLKRVRAAFDELRVQYDRLKKQLLDPETLEKYTILVRKHKKRISLLQDEFQAVQETIRLVQFAEASYEQIAQIQVLCKDKISEESFAKAEADNKWDVKAFEEKLEHAENWEQYQRDNARYTEAYEGLSRETLRALKINGDETEKLAANRAKKVRELKEDVISLGNDLDRESALIATLRDFALSKLQKPEGNVEDLKTAQRAYLHQLEHAEQFAEGKCETCGQVVKVKDAKVLRLRVKKLRDQIESHLEYERYTAARKEYLDAKQRAKDLQTDYDAKNNRLKTLEPWLKIHKELQALPVKPEQYKGKKLSVKIIRKCLEEVQEVRYMLQHTKPHLDTVIDFLSLKKEDVRKAKASEGLNDEMNGLQHRLSNLMAKIELHKTIKEQVADMRDRLLTMKKELRDEPALKHLVAGYQDKNIKKMAVEAISQHLMALVNRYAQRIMPEKFLFEFKWDSQIRILVHRHHGKKVSTSDVRKLSGAESTLFTIILVCALLAFVPSHKRCNLMILDEPTARFSPAMEEVFKDLLPILNQIVPSIIVITPKNEVYPGARVYTVVKENGEARIVPGFPHEANATSKIVRKKK